MILEHSKTSLYKSYCVTYFEQLRFKYRTQFVIQAVTKQVDYKHCETVSGTQDTVYVQEHRYGTPRGNLLDSNYLYTIFKLLLTWSNEYLQVCELCQQITREEEEKERMFIIFQLWKESKKH